MPHIDTETCFKKSLYEFIHVMLASTLYFHMTDLAAFVLDISFVFLQKLFDVFDGCSYV